MKLISNADLECQRLSAWCRSAVINWLTRVYSALLIRGVVTETETRPLVHRETFQRTPSFWLARGHQSRRIGSVIDRSVPRWYRTEGEDVLCIYGGDGDHEVGCQMEGNVEENRTNWYHDHSSKADISKFRYNQNQVFLNARDRRPCLTNKHY